MEIREKRVKSMEEEKGRRRRIGKKNKNLGFLISLVF
jgi:hypothetical protein